MQYIKAKHRILYDFSSVALSLAISHAIVLLRSNSRRYNNAFGSQPPSQIQGIKMKVIMSILILMQRTRGTSEPTMERTKCIYVSMNWKRIKCVNDTCDIQSCACTVCKRMKSVKSEIVVGVDGGGGNGTNKWQKNEKCPNARYSNPQKPQSKDYRQLMNVGCPRFRFLYIFATSLTMTTATAVELTRAHEPNENDRFGVFLCFARSFEYVRMRSVHSSIYLLLIELHVSAHMCVCVSAIGVYACLLSFAFYAIGSLCSTDH